MGANESDAAVHDLAHLLTRLSSLRRPAAWDGAAFTFPDLHEAIALVRSHQPADPPCTEAPSQASIDALVAWATSRGAKLAPGLRVLAGADDGTRVEAMSRVEAGSLLVEVPIDLMIRTSRVLADHATLGPWLAGGPPPFGPGTLMLWLMDARWGGGAGALSPYVDALPRKAPATALSWPRSPGEHLTAASTARAFLTGVLQLYCMTYWRLQKTPPDERPWPLEAFTVERWLWAGAVLSSRQTEVSGELALVPLWDLLNHDESLGAPTTGVEESALRCVAGRDYARGEPVAMYYGRRTPTEHWVYGGFVTPGPPDGARAMAPFPLPVQAPLRRDKLVWLLASKDIPLEVPVARGDLDAAQKRARWYALDVDDLDHLGVSSVADAWGTLLALTPDGEARAREILDQWLLGRAGGASSVEPFSVEHARILAAARAYYGGLVV